MKKTIIALIASAIGFFCGSYHISRVYAQQAGQTFYCQSTNTGGPSVQCSQYLVQIQSQRGFPKFQIFQVQGQPLAIDGSSGSSFAQYAVGSSVSTQVFELASGEATATISVAEP